MPVVNIQQNNEGVHNNEVLQLADGTHYTSREQDEHIVEPARDRPLRSSVKLMQDLQLPCGPRRCLHETRVHCFILAKKDMLTVAYKEARLGFALQFSAVNLDYRKRVVFTDEK